MGVLLRDKLMAMRKVFLIAGTAIVLVAGGLLLLSVTPAPKPVKYSAGECSALEKQLMDLAAKVELMNYCTSDSDCAIGAVGPCDVPVLVNAKGTVPALERERLYEKYYAHCDVPVAVCMGSKKDEEIRCDAGKCVLR